MRPRSLAAPGCGVPALARALTLLLALAPAGLAAQSLPILSPVSPTSQTLRPGPVTLQARMLFRDGTPAIKLPVTWRVIETTAGAYGGGAKITDFNGYTTAQIRIPRSGRTTVRVSFSNFGTGAAQNVDFEIVTRQSTTPPPPPTGGGDDPIELGPAGPTALALTLGERGTVAVRATAGGQGVPGLAVRFAVESSPGSPGVGRSDQTVATGGDGVAAATFGFSTAGRTTIRATVVDPGVDAEPDSILFTVDTASLGTLDPTRESYRSVGEALDEICRAVFVDASGQQRPQPEPTPICVYMTGTLGTEEQRADAMRAFAPTGIGAQATTAVAGLEQQLGSIQSRLAALRGGALRGAVDQIALDLDGAAVSGEAIAAAFDDRARRDRFGRRVDAALAAIGGDAVPPVAQDDVPALRERPWGFFVTGRWSQGERERGVEESGFDFDTLGATVGVDRAISANGFVGFAVSSLASETDVTGGLGSVDTDALAGTLYLIGEGERGYVQGTATFGTLEFDQRRVIDLPVLGDLEARADFDGEQLGATLELGRSVDGRAGSLTFFARGNWAKAEIDGFREQGAVTTIPSSGFGPVDFGLEVGEQELESLLGEAGLDWGRAFSTGGGLVIPQLTATWSHEFEDDPRAVAARFLADASGATFEVLTDEPDADWLTLSGALRFQFLWGSFFVSYDHELLRDDLEIRTANAGLRFEF
jgi:uncharacterized protein YhjY with autotransporter beta-barrel domain